jgi:uncharacterized membrane protein
MSDSSPNHSLEESDHRQLVRKNIYDGAVLSSPFLIMNALATLIACCGLLQDSAAVVIGAMVIATLMGPITGIALSRWPWSMATTPCFGRRFWRPSAV